jgi:hypothetical protein
VSGKFFLNGSPESQKILISGLADFGRILMHTLALQTRTKVLNDDLEDVFRGWYPAFHARAA